MPYKREFALQDFLPYNYSARNAFVARDSAAR